MKKAFFGIFSALLIFFVTACGNSGENEKSANAEKVSANVENKTDNKTENKTDGQTENKILVAYFSCTGTTKNLAESAAEILNADLYEIKPKIPYTSEDLNYSDETTRSTVEQKDEKIRPELADKNANIEKYQTIVIAYPIWWNQEPRIIDTFVESYNFDGKKILPISTSGGSDITSSVDHLRKIAKGDWEDGKCFMRGYSKDDLKNWLDSQNL